MKRRLANSMVAAVLVFFAGLATCPAQAQAPASAPATSAASMLIDSMDGPSAWKCEQNESSIVMSADDSPHEGKAAVKFNVKLGKTYAVAYRLAKPDAAWNDYGGLSFWVKGDGSDNYGCLRVQAGSWDKAWLGNFPLKDAEWHEVRLAWGDLVPSGASIPELGTADGCRPGDINLVAFGKSWNFNTSHKSPEITFSIDDLRLVRGVKSSRTRVSVDKFPPVSAVVEKLKAGKPVTILALGDSITWGTNVDGNAHAYPAMLGKMLSEYYKNDKITVVNKAIGGSTTAKGRQWLNRDVRGVEADLVTVMFGFNEMPSEKTRDKDAAAKAFTANLVRYIEEAAGTMKAPPACVFIATVPGKDKHWETLDPYAAAVRELVKAHPNTAVADANGRIKSLGKEAYARMMTDEAHPNADGHREIAKALFETITGVKAPEPAPSSTAPGAH
ncbi:MAG: GDSL-type esterase/lipase family protein [Phycisphaerae bacterium]